MPETTITDRITIGGGGGGPVRSETISVPAVLEAVAGGRYGWMQNIPRALPFAIDDLTADFGDDIYERMLFDPAVNAALSTLKTAILADGVGVTPAIVDADEPGQTQSQAIADFISDCLATLQPSLDDTLMAMLDALAFGNKVAEQVYAIGDGKLRLTSLKVKPRKVTVFVVDAYLNVLGLIGLIPGQPMPVTPQLFIVDPGAVSNLLPRDKFAVLTNWPRDSDPRGTSILRPAYRPWWDKQQLVPEYMKYLSQFGSPSMVATAPPDAFAYVPEGGDPLTAAPSAVQRIATALAGFKNGTYLVLPYGATAAPITVPTDGQSFTLALERCDRQISVAILHQTLATGESDHQTRAAASVHQDVLALLVRMGKRAVAGMLRTDVFRPLVRYNFGDDAAARLTPFANLAEIENEDQTSRMTAVAALAGQGLILPSQLAELYGDLGLPDPSPEELQEYAEAHGPKAMPPPLPPGVVPPGTPRPPGAPGTPGAAGAQPRPAAPTPSR